MYVCILSFVGDAKMKKQIMIAAIDFLNLLFFQFFKVVTGKFFGINSKYYRQCADDTARRFKFPSDLFLLEAFL